MTDLKERAVPRRRGRPKGYDLKPAELMTAEVYDLQGRNGRTAANESINAKFADLVSSIKLSKNSALDWLARNPESRRSLSPHLWSRRTYATLRKAYYKISRAIRKDPQSYRRFVVEMPGYDAGPLPRMVSRYIHFEKWHS